MLTCEKNKVSKNVQVNLDSTGFVSSFEHGIAFNPASVLILMESSVIFNPVEEFRTGFAQIKIIFSEISLRG